MSTWLDDWDSYNGWSSKKTKWGGKGDSKKTKTSYQPCWKKHKPIKILNGTVLGSACGQPSDGYDIYIGLDRGMKFLHSKYPWEDPDDAVIEFLYPITDMCAPKSIKSFRAMIKWMAEQLKAGKNIHIGCIGGHGRTGTVLAALVAYTKTASPKKAIQWVRKHHCKKAVESDSQIKFLMKHFKVGKAEPTKSYGGGAKTYGGWSSVNYADCDIMCIKSPYSIW